MLIYVNNVGLEPPHPRSNLALWHSTARIGWI